MEKFCKVEYDNQIPNSGYMRGRNERSEEYMKIKDFVNSSHETMMFVYNTPKDATKRRQSLDVTIRREHIPVKIHVRKNELYVSKMIKKETPGGATPRESNN